MLINISGAILSRYECSSSANFVAMSRIRFERNLPRYGGKVAPQKKL
jgi:hypothetical protein